MSHSYNLQKYNKILMDIQKYEHQFEFYNSLFLDNDCNDHHPSCNCAFDHFQKSEEARAMLKLLEEERSVMNAQYDLKKTSSYLTYGLTIGSSEKTDTQPCLYLWDRFINSADGKRCHDVEAYFEKGDNGYIHIHAILRRDQKFSMSFAKLRKRYGIRNKKQHNFDPIRLKTNLDIIKWKNYIKKDSHKSWNSKHNNSIKIPKM